LIRGEADIKMAKNMKRLIIFARDVAPPASYAPVW
jgi:hypothetical protein